MHGQTATMMHMDMKDAMVCPMYVVSASKLPHHHCHHYPHFMQFKG